MHKATSTAQRDPPAPEPGASGPSRAIETRARILVVEDEPGIVDFVRRGLEAEGFLVESALDGTEGERLAPRIASWRDRG